MASEKKQSGSWWPCWLCIGLVAVLIAYPLSAGPVQWIAGKTLLPMWLETGIEYFYAPLNMAIHYVPRPVLTAYVRYLRWWSPYAE
jgi:hypothetical protein